MKSLAGAVAAVLWATGLALGAAVAEPVLQGMNPLAGRAGTTYRVAIAGTGLASIRGLSVEEPGVRVRLVEAAADRLMAEITLDTSVTPGEKRMRAVGPRGVTNAVSWHVVKETVLGEKPELMLTPGLVVNGSLAEPGEVDLYAVEAKAGEVLTFEVVAGGSAFDPVVTLQEPAADSWFSTKGWKRLAFNDEELFFPGLTTQARLTHVVQQAGRYRVQVAGFAGHGGAGASYFLRVGSSEGERRWRHPMARPDWNERSFVRQLGGDWMGKLQARGGVAQSPPPPVRLAGTEAGEGVLALPGILEGRLSRPAMVHKARLRIERATQLAIEIETPEATLPEFNPVVTVFDATGREVATNVHTKRNNNGLYMMKMIHAKTTFAITAPGDYTVQVRDITTDHGRPEFFYRVLIRPQIPHVGRVEMPEDRLNLAVGKVRLVMLQLEREEDFRDPVMATIEGLPPGVTVLPGAENPVERPPLQNAGRIERYIPKTTQSFSFLLNVAEGATLTETIAWPRVVVRPVKEQRLAAPILEKRFPLMVVQ